MPSGKIKEILKDTFMPSGKIKEILKDTFMPSGKIKEIQKDTSMPSGSIKEILKVCLLNSDLFCDTIPKDRSHKINRRSYEA